MELQPSDCPDCRKALNRWGRCKAHRATFCKCGEPVLNGNSQANHSGLCQRCIKNLRGKVARNAV